MSCPCGSELSYDACCGLYHSGARRPPTALALMRSRYAAYVRCDIDYLARTLAPESQADFHRGAAEEWARAAKWQSLTIVETVRGEEGDDDGVVEFVASYRLDGRLVEHAERSEFRKAGDQWLFVRGAPPGPSSQPKIGRNDPCPCGSGKKYKKCCGA